MEGGKPAQTFVTGHIRAFAPESRLPTQPGNFPMQRIIAACLGVCATGLLAVPATSQARPFEPMDVFALQWVDNPQISPDGNRIVYQRMGFSVMQDRKQSSLWMTDADGRNHRPLADSVSIRCGPRMAGALPMLPRRKVLPRSRCIGSMVARMRS